MAKYYGMIGFGSTEETDPSIFEDVIVERPYSGDIIRNTRRWSQKEYPTGNLTISNEFSVIGDPYAFENFHAIRYLTWMGSKWVVESIDATQYPRLILTVGGLYNGD